jgi:hypothetical protein
MTASLLIAFKKILGGIVSIFLISGILKAKSLYSIDTIRKHIKDEFSKNPTKATRLYGNDIEAYLSQNYPDKNSFFELVIINAYRPLLVLIMISVLDFQNTLIILLEILLVILVIPVEIYFGDKWKGNKWYISLVSLLWVAAFIVLTYSNYLQKNPSVDNVKTETNGKSNTPKDSLDGTTPR